MMYQLLFISPSLLGHFTEWHYLHTRQNINIPQTNSYEVKSQRGTKLHNRTFRSACLMESTCSDWNSDHHRQSPSQSQQLGEFQSLQVEPIIRAERNVRLYNLVPYSDFTSYEFVWDMQKELVQHHIDRISSRSQVNDSKSINSQFITDYTETQPKGVDSVIFVQHEPIYTLGTASDVNFIKQQHAQPVKVVRIERGGEVTYHGPGQLVIYPILDLRGYKQDIHWYLRALEQCILMALNDCGISGAQREEDLTGIWIQGKKVAALGVKVKKWITMHGISINVEKTSLSNFKGIVPCGLVGREVCCVNEFLHTPMTVDEFASRMIHAMQEIFHIQLHKVDDE